MNTRIELKLFATLKRFTPEFSDSYPISAGITVSDLLEQLGVPMEEVNLVFINDQRGNLTSTLEGGERISIFPPLGGG